MIIFAGSFDPFHRGHEFMLNYVQKHFDEEVKVVVQQNPWKNQGRFTLEQRRNMINYAFPDLDVVVDTSEYFYQLAEKYPEAKFVLGGDSFGDLKQWKNSEQFLDREYIVFSRGTVKSDLPFPPNISSTLLRVCDDNMKDNIPQKIWHYLCYHNLVKDYFRPAVACDVIVRYQNKVLVLKRKGEPFKDTYVFPGGHLDDTDDNLVMCAQRELKEETGIDVKLTLLGEKSEKDRDPRKRIISFIYHGVVDNPKVTLSEENDEYLWHDLDEHLEWGFDHKSIFELYKKQNT